MSFNKVSRSWIEQCVPDYYKLKENIYIYIIPYIPPKVQYDGSTSNPIVFNKLHIHNGVCITLCITRITLCITCHENSLYLTY